MQKAINSYLIAEKATSDHDTLLTLIYDNLGTCYKNQDFYDKALEVYIKTHTTFINNTIARISYTHFEEWQAYMLFKNSLRKLLNITKQLSPLHQVPMTLHGSLSYFVIFPGFMTIKPL